MESRAAGMEPPLDTVWVDLSDAEGFVASARHAAQLGFQGKMCIHPDQIAGANAAFSPDEATIAHARRIVEAFDRAEKDGRASIQLDRQFIDYPIVERARRILEQGGA
jgi:citrate lyase subunit beta/citryl-CoA lyase